VETYGRHTAQVHSKLSALNGGAQQSSHSGCLIPHGTARNPSGTQNGRGRSAVEKQSLSLADFEPLFSVCADGSLVTALKLSWLRWVYFILFCCGTLSGPRSKMSHYTENRRNWTSSRHNRPIQRISSLQLACLLQLFAAWKRRKFSYGPLASLLCGIHTKKIYNSSYKSGDTRGIDPSLYKTLHILSPRCDGSPCTRIVSDIWCLKIKECHVFKNRSRHYQAVSQIAG
jgi:hypothetical protein